ncbi:MAG TPA: hypothetical protein VJU81_17825 [Methylomirabilota bacterium]|nr:hypothetical protein [Methylomirabilota bacterium]
MTSLRSLDVGGGVLAAPALTTPLFGLLIAREVTGDRLTPPLLVSGVRVALGIGLTT